MYALALDNLDIIIIICSSVDFAFFFIPISHSRHSFTTSTMANSVSLTSLISNTSLAVTLHCWEQNPPHEGQLTPLTYVECKQAIHDIPMGEKALAPLSFGRDPGAGFTVPYVCNLPVQVALLN